MADRIAVMNGGLIEQFGSPTEVYERPRTHFVANFIGQANFLAARVGPGNRTGQPGRRKLLQGGRRGPGPVRRRRIRRSDRQHP